jgi:FtsH-binding integral membrane protein
MNYQQRFLAVYAIVFVLCILRARRVLSEKGGYVQEVHSVLAVIMTYHMLVASVFVHADPAIAKSPWFSVCNTAASILCAIGFYLTSPENRIARYTWNFVYLLFASVLMGELWIYFGLGPEMFSGASLIFVVFVLDAVFYKRARRKGLIVAYVGIMLSSIMSAFYLQGRSAAAGFALNGAYLLAVIAWLYHDHDTLASDPTPHHLDDALKYFYDFEGTIIRYLNNTRSKKN